MKAYLKKCLPVLLGVTFLGACKKDSNENPGTNPRAVKYEISGNYSGQLLVVYSDNISGNTTVTVTALPWIKQMTMPANVTGIGLGGNAQTNNPGSAGQTAIVKIYSGGNVVKSATAIADSNGLMNLAVLTYIFP